MMKSEICLTVMGANGWGGGTQIGSGRKMLIARKKENITGSDFS